MKRIVLVLIVLIVNLVIAHDNIKMKAILHPDLYSNKPNYCLSDDAYSLYSKMGYNTLFSYIALNNSNWDKSNPLDWKLIDAEVKGIKLTRTGIVDYIKDQKELLQKYNIEYCPFYEAWGWGLDKIRISERCRQSVYREVEFIPSEINVDLYPNLVSTGNITQSNWGETSFLWGPNSSNVTLSLNNSNANIAVGINTDTLNLRPGQLYEFSLNIVVPVNSNLKEGDLISVDIYREFVNKPSSDIPISKILNPNNNWSSQSQVFYRVVADAVAGNNTCQFKEDRTNTVQNVHVLPISRKIWIDNDFNFGPGGYRFNEKVRWEINFCSSNKSRTGIASFEVTDFEIKMLDPRDELAYPNWEQSSDYQQYLNNYPNEVLFRTRAIYSNVLPDGTTNNTETNFYSSTIPAGALTTIKGHFLPLKEEENINIFRHTADPLSPSFDLIEREILSIIKDGLGNEEPEYYHLAGDEVTIFRTDTLTKRNNGLSSQFNNMSNGEFFAAVIHNNLKRYKDVFGINKNNGAKTKFLLFGDMILPFGKGYIYAAESDNDQDALEYIRDNISPLDTLIPEIWLYDYNKSRESAGKFYLNEANEVQQNIDRLKDHNLRFIAHYATDGGIYNNTDININSFVNPITPITTDIDHIQHEIDLARKWCDYAQDVNNSSSFEGYSYSGWGGEFRSNKWNGIYPLAYFGWWKVDERDLASEIKAIDANADSKGEAVLKYLKENRWPYSKDITPVINLLLD